jgi:hypothetical protein
MIIVYEMAAIGAAAITAVSIWHKMRVRKQIRAIDARLAKMQKEIEVLQMQESRRVMLALRGNSKVESPGIEPDDSNDADRDRDVVRLVGKSRTTPVP